MQKTTKEYIIFVVAEVFKLAARIIEGYLYNSIDTRPESFDLHQYIADNNMTLEVQPELTVDPTMSWDNYDIY